ncbi:MAG: beta-propeller fold lactonase family protein [Fimbriimonadaceae bacterium]|nr:beta-propeller fold lactonase family protein [Fimbriimonadaceae bacterium]
MTRRFGLIVLFAAALAGAAMLGRRLQLGPQSDGSFLVSSGFQAVTPVGKLARFEYSRPKQVVVSPDGATVAVAAHNKLHLLTPDLGPIASLDLNAAPVGLVWAPDGRTIYASAEGGKVATFSASEGKWTVGPVLTVDDATIPAAERRPQPADPQPTGLAIAPDGKTLYVALGIRNSVAVLDLESGKIERHVPVGVAPYHVALSPDGLTLAVANRGGARYPMLDFDSAPTAGTPARIERATDAALTGSVTLLDTRSWQGTEVPVQRQPSGMCFLDGGARLVVTESDSDSLSFLDVGQKKVLGNLSVRPEQDPEFGQMPTDVVAGADGKRLYVTCGGLNAVAVVSLGDLPRVEGFVPTGWYPLSIARAGDRLFVACAKGVGSRPASKTTKFGVHDSVGALVALGPADVRDLRRLTARVAKNNRWTDTPAARQAVVPVPVPARVGEPSLFKRVVYIIKENLTYDAVLGDLKEGNGDPSLCMFPEEVTPNTHRLAREFVVLDNFYISGTNSADGHQWVSSSIANAYSEQNYASNARSYPYDGGDPLAYSPKGFLWNAAHRAGHRVRIFGEFVNEPKLTDPRTGKTPSWKECWEDHVSGRRQIVVEAKTDQHSLRPHLQPNYIGFPMNLPDQVRADVFLEQLAVWEREGEMPALTMLLLPNDHTAGTNPAFPTPRAMAADNDLALGRIVEGITKSAFWKDTLILIVQDDSQLGVDHVDGHRSLALVVSPYTKRGVTVSEMYDHTSFARTIGLVLGLPPMNRFDRVGRPLFECFTTKANLAPYAHLPARIALDEMNPPRQALRGEALRHAIASERLDIESPDAMDPEASTRAVWFSTMPGRPFPERHYRPTVEDD